MAQSGIVRNVFQYCTVVSDFIELLTCIVENRKNIKSLSFSLDVTLEARQEIAHRSTVFLTPKSFN